MSFEHDPRAILAEIDGRAKKRFGQHFLAKPETAERIVRAAMVREGDRVVEIGPGLGILTEALVRAGAELVAVELDSSLAIRLRTALPQVRLIEGDALRLDWAAVLGGADWSVVANLPYNVGTHIIMDILRRPQTFRRATVMLQAEVIARLVATPGSKAYGALSVERWLRADARKLIEVPPGAFHPPPKVDSTVACFDLLPAPRSGDTPVAQVERVVRAAFAQRRKTLRNTLGSAFGKERAFEAMERAGVDANKRAEVLEPEAFVALAAALALTAASTSPS